MKKPLKPITAYRHILWDWNGTLLDDTAHCSRIINGMLADRNLPTLTIDEHRRQFDFPVVRFYERLGFDFDRESFEDLSMIFISEYYRTAAQCGMHPGTKALLTRIHELGVGQSILSASRQEHLDEMVAHFQIRHLLRDVMGIETIFAPGKTARGRNWMNQSGLEPDEVILIGDTVHDFEVATAIGVDCCLVSWGAHDTEKLAATGAPVCQALSELSLANWQ